jgi:hypothetical protein
MFKNSFNYVERWALAIAYQSLEEEEKVRAVDVLLLTLV